jgi:hypothetical protein
VLLAQMIDVACWWLARLDGIGPYFALTIMVTGAIVGVGLLLQILLTLFDLFGSAGKIVLIMLATGAVFGAFVLKYAVVDPQLATERAEIEEVVHQNVFDEPAPPAEKGKTPPRAEEKPNVMPKVE